MADALGLIRVVSNDELVAAEQAAEAASEAARLENDSPLLQGLAKHVMDCWGKARTAKQAVLPRLQAATRARMGEYSPAKLAEIRQFGGSEAFLRIIPNKCKSLKALLVDIYLGQTDRPWTLSATPSPQMPPELEATVKAQLAQEVAGVYAVMGQMPDPTMTAAVETALRDKEEERVRDAVRARAARMERRMDDQLAEGNFRTAMAQFIADFAHMPTAILEGPCIRKRKKLTWSTGPGGTRLPVIEDVLVPEFSRVDPYRAYPAPGAESPQDGYFIYHESLAYDDLYAMLDTPGVNNEAVRAALREADHGGLSDWMGWSEISDRPDKDFVSPSLKRETHDIDVLKFYGAVKGRDLLDWDDSGEMAGEIDDPEASYEAVVWMTGEWVIKATLNYDPLGRRPYWSASYEAIPGEFWGESIPDMLRDIAGDDGIAQAATRALTNNMMLASGPMVGLNVDRLQEGEDLTTLHPWKIFQLRDAEYGNTADRPIEFFQPAMHAQELQGVIRDFDQYADEHTMLPGQAVGESPRGGVGRTASAFAMSLDGAGKGLKDAVLNIDMALTGALQMLFTHNMLYDPDETIKGDAQVIARGATGLMQVESRMLRVNEALNNTNNPVDLQIMGLSGRAHLLRETFKRLDMDTSKLLQGSTQPAAAPPPPNGQQPDASQEQLANGAPTTDNFSPTRMASQ